MRSQYVGPGYECTKAGDVSVPETGARLVQGGALNHRTWYQGENVIVVIFDTGIDWKHLDFRDLADPKKSRILYLWDQTLTPTGSETSPSGFGYGVEYTKAQIDNELDGSPAGFVRETDTDGHGTHVAGTAAGNGGALYGKYVGMAPKADLIIIKGGNGSFTESNMINGIAYAQQKRQALGKPVSMNFSIGSRGGPHDGSGGWESAIDAFTASPGNVVTVSAGNYAEPIHVSGTIPASGDVTISFTVPNYTPTSGTNNDKLSLDLWVDGNPDVSAIVLSPGGVSYRRDAGQIGDAPNTSDGTITLYNTVNPNNDCRNIVFRVTDPTASTPRSGTWLPDNLEPVSYGIFLRWMAVRVQRWKRSGDGRKRQFGEDSWRYRGVRRRSDHRGRVRDQVLVAVLQRLDICLHGGETGRPISACSAAKVPPGTGG